MSNDPFADFKARQREAWSTFAPLEIFTTPPAARLVRFAGITGGQRVLDVGCGTGPASITAARAGAQVTGIDLSPALLERAHLNAKTASVAVSFQEGDAEALPFEDGAFDVVVSQFGHMFAPRPHNAVAQMLRVLRPGGCIAFSTWPPEHMVGRMFALTARYVPPPEGVAPPPQWGDPNVVRQRLGDAVRDLQFERGVLAAPTLSFGHYLALIESTGPLGRVAMVLADQPDRLVAFRMELEALFGEHYADNEVRQNYLMSRATKL
jgi:SAM-dependent methyltransferase